MLINSTLQKIVLFLQHVKTTFIVTILYNIILLVAHSKLHWKLLIADVAFFIKLVSPTLRGTLTSLNEQYNFVEIFIIFDKMDGSYCVDIISL